MKLGGCSYVLLSRYESSQKEARTKDLSESMFRKENKGRRRIRGVTAASGILTSANREKCDVEGRKNG